MRLTQVFRNYWVNVSEASRLLWCYRRTFWWLLRKRGVRMAYNFLYMKLFVKEGEGSLGWAYWVALPLIKVLRRRYALNTPYPRNVEIEITTKCNKRCIHCENVYWNQNERREHLTLECFRSIVDQFPGLKWVNVTGEGDAFLNPDFPAMLEHLKQRRVCVYLADSFDRIDREFAELLIRLGIDGLYLSMDAATAETYNRIKLGSDFDRVCHNVEQLLQLKREFKSPIPELCFRYVILTENVQEMPDFVSLVGRWQRDYDLGDGSRLEFAGLLSFPEIEHLFVPEVPAEVAEEVMCRAKEHGVRVGMAHHSVSATPPPERCSAWVEPYIMMGGYVMPCCAVLQNNRRDFLRAHCLGNLYETPLRELWRGEHYRQFRAVLAQPEGPIPSICYGCRVYDTVPRGQKYGYVKYRPEGIVPVSEDELRL